MKKIILNQMSRISIFCLFVLLSFPLFAQRPVDALITKYEKKPLMGMETFSMKKAEKDEMVTVLNQYGAYAPATLSANYYENLVDYKVISCIGPDAENFYNEAIAYFDTQEGYTNSRSRMGNMRGKGYTLISKDKNGNTTKETNSIMLVAPDENDPDMYYRAVVMTIVTRETE